jgi:hypothetical protein
MKRLLCLGWNDGWTLSSLNRWLDVAKEHQVQLIIADLPADLLYETQTLANSHSAHLSILPLKSHDRGRVLLQMRAENLRQPFDGVIAFNQQWLTLVAQLALEWGLPGIDPEVANEMEKSGTDPAPIEATTESVRSALDQVL